MEVRYNFKEGVIHKFQFEASFSSLLCIPLPFPAQNGSPGTNVTLKLVFDSIGYMELDKFNDIFGQILRARWPHGQSEFKFGIGCFNMLYIIGLILPRECINGL